MDSYSKIVRLTHYHEDLKINGVRFTYNCIAPTCNVNAHYVGIRLLFIFSKRNIEYFNIFIFVLNDI